MFSKVNFIFNGSEVTGYGQHAKYFWGELSKLIHEGDQGVCNIILSTVDSPDFYKQYEGTKIAFNVWESTEYPEHFFKKLLEFDQLWVPSNWQRDCVIKQGYPAEKVKVIPEGVDGNIYNIYTHQLTLPDFNFIHVGKWEYRKSTKEIIETFLKTFPREEYPYVKLYLLVDTMFPTDGMSSTKERLEKYGFNNDDRIIDLPFQTKEEYINILQLSHCFVSCARAEGWNLPLIEAIACGIPSICSKYGAQLDFHYCEELQVKIKDYKKPEEVYNMSDCPGTWAEPDFEDLSNIMKVVYNIYPSFKENFIKNRNDFVEKWSWKNAAIKAVYELEILSQNFTPKVYFNYHFVKGPFIEIKGNSNSSYNVEFRDLDNFNEIEYSTNIKCNHWTKASTEYFRNWNIIVKENNKEVFSHRYNANEKRVYICFDSKAIGDTIAWFPYCVEFSKKHNCKVIVSSWHNYLFEKTYPEVEFVKPGTSVPNIYAQYNIGVYHENRQYKHPRDWRTVPLQRIASDILGLEFKEIKPNVDISNAYTATVKRPKKYICISEHSTAKCKYWHHQNGWQKLVDYFNENGYNVVSISKEHSGLKNVINANGNHIDVTMGILLGCEYYIGLASGLAWLAWALGKKVVMISGFSAPFVEFQSNNIRIEGKGDCTACLNDIFIPDRAWDEGCFHNKDFSCTKEITPEDIINQIPIDNNEKKVLDFTTAPILRYSSRQTTFKKYVETIYNNFENPNLIEIGTVRRLPNDPDLPGDGNSTAIFAWYVKNYGGHITAVDISESSINNCRITLNHQNVWNNNITLICEDGLKFLKKLKTPIHAIYIDGLDWERNDPEKQKLSEEFHLKALKLAEKNLVVGSVVMFDDVFDFSFTGKGKLAIPYALNSGNYELLCQDYQVCLRKIK